MEGVFKKRYLAWLSTILEVSSGASEAGKPLNFIQHLSFGKILVHSVAKLSLYF